MKRTVFIYGFLLTLFVFLTSCERDLGPYEEITQTYTLTNFDRLDMASAFHIDVRAGSTFAIEARGNRSDVNDLKVYTRGGTLHAEYQNNRRSRRYDMHITVTMPTLRGVSFAGATKSTITGFTNLNDLDIELSGASKSDVTLSVARLVTNLSGASNLTVNGNADMLRSKVSGASKLEAYDLVLNDADLDVSGASNVRVQVKNALSVKASGASKVRYRGTPRVNSDVSGASTVERE